LRTGKSIIDHGSGQAGDDRRQLSECDRRAPLPAGTMLHRPFLAAAAERHVSNDGKAPNNMIDLRNLISLGKRL